MSNLLLAPEILTRLFEAIEEILSTCVGPTRPNGADSSYTVSADVLSALEDAYDAVIDRLIEDEEADAAAGDGESVP